MNKARIILFLGSCFILIHAGCWRGANPLQSGIVNGKVLNGTTPVSKAEVRFISASGPMATGWTKDDGTYRLFLPDGSEGALVGENEVSVVTGLPDPESIASVNPEGMVLIPKSTTPSYLYRFAQPVVVQKGTNDVVLDLGKSEKRKN
ncbi:hypothetical protein [Planctomicrobium sp. SH527]|uniref:hypothetical protein n=1 Tax=Planctomicrobium sp. SH527 TaxID=3448123 RepID=UPI003F5C8683